MWEEECFKPPLPLLWINSCLDSNLKLILCGQKQGADHLPSVSVNTVPWHHCSVTSCPTSYRNRSSQSPSIWPFPNNPHFNLYRLDQGVRDFLLWLLLLHLSSWHLLFQVKRLLEMYMCLKRIFFEERIFSCMEKEISAKNYFMVA